MGRSETVPVLTHRTSHTEVTTHYLEQVPQTQTLLDLCREGLLDHESSSAHCQRRNQCVLLPLGVGNRPVQSQVKTHKKTDPFVLCAPHRTASSAPLSMVSAKRPAIQKSHYTWKKAPDMSEKST